MTLVYDFYWIHIFSHRIGFFKVNMKAFCSRHKQHLELFHAFHVNIYHVIFENITWWYENVCGNTYRSYKIYSTAFCLSLYVETCFQINEVFLILFIISVDIFSWWNTPSQEQCNELNIDNVVYCIFQPSNFHDFLLW